MIEPEARRLRANARWISPRRSLIVVMSVCLLVTACSSSPTTPASAGASAPAATAAAPSAAPSTGPASASAEVTLSIIQDWAATDPKGPAQTKAFDDFQKANPNIHLDVSTFSDVDADTTKVPTLFLADQEPDLVFAGLWAPTLNWLEKGIAVPVNDYLTQWGLADKFSDTAIKSFTTNDGKLQAFPVEGWNWPIMYNKAIFDKAGVPIPTTTDELIADVPKLKATGAQVWAAAGGGGEGHALMLGIIQSAMTDDEIKDVFHNGGFSTNADAKKGVELFVALRDAGVFQDGAAGLDAPHANQTYYDGKAAMVHDASGTTTSSRATCSRTRNSVGSPCRPARLSPRTSTSRPLRARASGSPATARRSWTPSRSSSSSTSSRR